VNSVIISESATADTTAPPTPCTARAATRSSWELAKPAREGGEREDADAEQEQPAMAEQVTQPAPEKEETAERQQVRVDDPRERRLREPEVLLDRRERHADDRHVEDDHQVSQAEYEQGQPASAVFRGHQAILLSSFMKHQTDHARVTHRSLARVLLAVQERSTNAWWRRRPSDARRDDARMIR